VEWLIWGFIGGFALLGLAHLIKSRISRSKEGPSEGEKKPAPRFQPWSLPAPQTPTLLDEPSDWTPPPEVAALGGYERVFTGGSGLSITPDGQEALVLHSDASATLFDVASGRALHTWTNICPPEWLENEVNFFFMSAKARRIFLTLSEKGWRRDGFHSHRPGEASRDAPAHIGRRRAHNGKRINVRKREFGRRVSCLQHISSALGSGHAGI
jgi:hypothetical protein